MSPIHLFLLVFLVICFSLVLIQRDLTRWQKISLLANPALLAVIISVLMTKTMDDSRCAADLAPVTNAVGELLAGGPDASSAGKTAAARLRKFIREKETDWNRLSEDLREILESRESPQEKKAGEAGGRNANAPDAQKK